MEKAEIEKLIEEHSEDDEEVEFSPTCSKEKLDDSFAKLEVSPPNELIKLLENTDGFSTDFAITVLSSSDIVETNLKYWNENFLSDIYMSFNSLLFFAEAGNGDLFAYRILEGKVSSNDIYVWNHENDSRVWVASNLKNFIVRSLKDNLEY